MQALNYTLELFRKNDVPFKLSSEEKSERELKVTRISVSQEHILKGHVQKYLKIVETLEKKKQKGRNSLIFLFKGYEQEPRHMYHVPEIKAWVERMFRNKPNLFYMLVNMNENYIHDMVLCLVKPEALTVPKAMQRYIAASSDLILNGADVTPAIRKVTESTFLYAKKLKHNPEELMDICMALLDNTQYEQHLANQKAKSS
ncbi:MULTISPECIES: hypothetical protein [unclassified Paenibacillus]|uniref:Uncharacterized protein n=1 Tax=Paenibacillus provencensis TaxID=441151 RepID=A0ABW3QBZ1_9BACL|nr:MULTISPECIES: hypothetical protein [unclassified Paenibacillus]MCM3130633.1 hypothetical protein [Paenibacillus sp. MER 78]SDX73987.1 hypothetical protein SAMN05518848_11336 [Paenibacillus sp. PDC88]SFS89575.1 hypothetical protein SAMN04488601_106156 [Paenibacillus sp. 453mf]